MLANDMKKGQVVVLRSGLRATIRDNMKGMARNVEIEEPAHDIGSIYVHKIAFAVLEDGSFEPITLTPSQQKRADWLIAFDQLSATEI